MMPASPVRANDRTLYQPPVDPVLIEVPSFEFVMIDGSGDPGTSPDYQAAVAALHAVSYPVVITLKRAGRLDLKVRPLEGLWWADNLSVFQPTSEDRALWRWTMMIRQPDDVPGDLYDAAVGKMAKKLGRAVAARVRIERFDEGLCVQLMHRGPYAGEGPNIARLHDFAAAQGLRLRGHHHEIYLSDPRKCAPRRCGPSSPPGWALTRWRSLPAERGWADAIPGLLLLVDALCAAPVRERRMAAVELLRIYHDPLRGEDMILLELLLRGSGTWALVDPLAASVIGPLAERHPEVGVVFDRWARDQDFWMRRAALLALLAGLRRGEGEFERFSRYADAMLDDKEFFVRKATGWVLRETAKERPNLVSAWLLRLSHVWPHLLRSHIRGISSAWPALAAARATLAPRTACGAAGRFGARGYPDWWPWVWDASPSAGAFDQPATNNTPRRVGVQPS
jgi:hypothetical protein